MIVFEDLMKVVSADVRCCFMGGEEIENPELYKRREVLAITPVNSRKIEVFLSRYDVFFQGLKDEK